MGGGERGEFVDHTKAKRNLTTEKKVEKIYPWYSREQQTLYE